MPAKKPKSTEERAAKAIDKARGSISYSFIEAEPKKFASMNSISGAKNKKTILNAQKAGAKIYSDRGITSDKRRTEYLVASKTDVAASKKKTLKASGTGFKATARQVKLERERTATRAAAKAKQAAKNKKK